MRFSKQRLTSVDYFSKQYPATGLFVVTLDRLVAPPEGIEALYPWELYRKFFK
ncbi:MAG: hypothetical protein GTN82_32910 [Candidatus Aminicenantes bacterium]|nr:hypothetical protein [Candidatus Aminicenantes bacterium]